MCRHGCAVLLETSQVESRGSLARREMVPLLPRALDCCSGRPSQDKTCVMEPISACILLVCKSVMPALTR